MMIFHIFSQFFTSFFFSWFSSFRILLKIFVVKNLNNKTKGGNYGKWGKNLIIFLIYTLLFSLVENKSSYIVFFSSILFTQQSYEVGWTENV